MPNDLNRCEFIGRLGADPEVRYMPSGGAVANFRIAVGKQWKNKDTGEKQESTAWVRITAFNKLGEICGKYLKKGSQVYVAGEFRERKWQGQDGQDRYTTEIVCHEMQMLGKAKSAPDAGAAPQNSAPAPSSSAGASGGDNDFDDDISF